MCIEVSVSDPLWRRSWSKQLVQRNMELDWTDILGSTYLWYFLPLLYTGTSTRKLPSTAIIQRRLQRRMSLSVTYPSIPTYSKNSLSDVLHHDLTQPKPPLYTADSLLVVVIKGHVRGGYYMAPPYSHLGYGGRLITRRRGFILRYRRVCLCL